MKPLSILPLEGKVVRLIGTLRGCEVPLSEALILIGQEVPSYVSALQRINASFEKDGVLTSFGREVEHFSAFTAEMVDVALTCGAPYEFCIETAILIESMQKLIEAGAEPKQAAEFGFYAGLGILTNYGCPILRALDIVSLIYGLEKEEAEKLIGPIRAGEMLIDGMKALPEYFSKIDIGYISIGEQTGGFPKNALELASIKAALLFRQSHRLGAPERDLSEDEIGKIRMFLFLTEVIDAGVPALRAIACVKREFEEGSKCASVLTSIEESITNGSTLSEAMELCSDYIPKYITRAVHYGEQQGTIETSLAVIAEYLKWEILGMKISIVKIEARK